MHLYVATTNPGKLRDFAAAATGTAVTLEPLPNLASIPTPPETAPTFAEVAATKAISYSVHAPGLTILADDSGLEVDALSGAPGVRSARFADDHAFRPARISGDGATHAPLSTDERNNLCLLDLLASTPTHCRAARYRCALVVARDGVVLATADGTVEGSILEAPRGTDGFGYDPLFLIPERGLTMAELSIADRLQFSHRGRALAALLEALLPSKLFSQLDPGTT